MKHSFVNISEVNRQCLHSLGTRSEDDFEKVSSTNVHAHSCTSRQLWLLVVGRGGAEEGRREVGGGGRDRRAASSSESIWILLSSSWKWIIQFALMCASVYLTSWNVAQGQQRDVEKMKHYFKCNSSWCAAHWKNEKVRYTDTECLLASRQVNKAKLALFIEGCRLLLTPPVLDKFKFSQKV